MLSSRALALAVALLAAGAQAGEPAPPRWYAPELVSDGAAVFARACARCHGANAQGAPDWQTRAADGRLPAPPLDGSGHAWHHRLAVLAKVVLDGSPGGSMPGFRGQLGRDEVAAVIAWFQSQWSDDVYAAWLDIEQRAR